MTDAVCQLFFATFLCQVPAKKVATPAKDSTAAMAELQDDIGDVLEGKWNL